MHKLRLRCEAIGIRRVDAAPTAVVITFSPRPNLDPLALIGLLQSRRDARMAGPERLRIDVSNEDPEARLRLVIEVLARLAPQARPAGELKDAGAAGSKAAAKPEPAKAKAAAPAPAAGRRARRR